MTKKCFAFCCVCSTLLREHILKAREGEVKIDFWNEELRKLSLWVRETCRAKALATNLSHWWWQGQSDPPDIRVLNTFWDVVDTEDETEDAIEIASMSWISSTSMKYSSRIERGDGQSESGMEVCEKGDRAIVNILLEDRVGNDLWGVMQRWWSECRLVDTRFEADVARWVWWWSDILRLLSIHYILHNSSPCCRGQYCCTRYRYWFIGMSDSFFACSQHADVSKTTWS